MWEIPCKEHSILGVGKNKHTLLDMGIGMTICSDIKQKHVLSCLQQFKHLVFNCAIVWRTQSSYCGPVGGLPQVSQGFLHQAHWKWPIVWMLEEMGKRSPRKAHMNCWTFSMVSLHLTSNDQAHNLLICFSVDLSLHPTFDEVC